MSEQLPHSPESLGAFQLGDRSLADWHRWLTTDAETGEDMGHLATPGSRYGRTSDRVAYWALAGGVVLEHANGEADETYEALEHFMGLAVNDDPSVAEVALDYWDILPLRLTNELGRRAEVKELIEGGEL